MGLSNLSLGQCLFLKNQIYFAEHHLLLKFLKINCNKKILKKKHLKFKLLLLFSILRNAKTSRTSMYIPPQ